MGKKRIAVKGVQEDVAQVQREGKEVKKKEFKRIVLPLARFYIRTGYNNTLIAITDAHGNVLAWSSTGLAGFRGTKKGTPYAGAKAVEVAAERIRKYDIGEVHMYVKGFGPGRDSAVRSFFNQGFNITMVKDTTPIPFSGVRTAKLRRV